MDLVYLNYNIFSQQEIIVVYCTDSVLIANTKDKMKSSSALKKYNPITQYNTWGFIHIKLCESLKL